MADTEMALDLGKMPDEQLLRYLNWRKKLMEDARKPWETVWQKAYDVYNMVIPPGKYAWRSKRFFPLITIAIQTVVPRIMQALFSADPWFSLTGRTHQDAQRADKSQALLVWEYDRVRRFRQMMDALMTVIMTTGVGILKQRWEDGINLVPIDPGCFYIDPEASLGDMNSAFDVIQTGIRVTGSYLKLATEREKQEIPFDKEVVEEILTNEGGDKLSEGLWETFKKDTGWPDSTKQIAFEDVLAIYELAEYWTNDWLIVGQCVDGEFKNILARVKNPFDHAHKPFYQYAMQPELFETYGRSFAYMLRFMQYQINDDMNAANDWRALRIAPPFVYRKSAGFKEFEKGNYVFEPGAAIGVTGDAAGAIFVPNIPDLPMSHYKNQELLLGLIQRFFGTDDYTMGHQGETFKTATEVERVVKEANIRFGRIVEIVAETNRDIVMDSYSLVQQFLSTPAQIRVLDKPMTVEQGDFMESYDVRINVTPTAGQQATEYAMFKDFYGIAKGNPHYNQVELDHRLLRKIKERDTEALWVGEPIRKPSLPMMPGRMGPPGNMPPGAGRLESPPPRNIMQMMPQIQEAASAGV